jgi:hypothetical protein
LLDEYARKGGALVIVGDFATFDEEKNWRPDDVAAQCRALGRATIPDIDFEAYLNAPGSRDAGTIRHDLEALLPQSLVTVPDAPVAALLGRSGGTIYCHLINKNLRDSGFQPQAGFKVVVTLPAGFPDSNLAASYVSPDDGGGEPVNLSLLRNGDEIEVTVPNLEVYGVLVISGANVQ